jgi:hypothetical protein
LEALYIRGKSLKLTLGGHRLLKNHFNALETFLFVLQLATKDVVAQFTVAACLVSQIV